MTGADSFVKKRVFYKEIFKNRAGVVVISKCVEMKHSDWLKLVLLLATSNQTALFHCR